MGDHPGWFLKNMSDDERGLIRTSSAPTHPSLRSSCSSSRTRRPSMLGSITCIVLPRLRSTLVLRLGNAMRTRMNWDSICCTTGRLIHFAYTWGNSRFMSLTWFAFSLRPSQRIWVGCSHCQYIPVPSDYLQHGASACQEQPRSGVWARTRCVVECDYCRTFVTTRPQLQLIVVAHRQSVSGRGAQRYKRSS